MKYFLFKLTNADPKEWVIYEYDSTFETPANDNAILVKEIQCKNGCSTHRRGNAFYIATTGFLEIRDGTAWIT